MDSSPYSRIREGMDVLDLAGDKIGTVAGVSGEAPPPNIGGDPDPVARNMEARRAGQGAAGHVEVRRTGHDLFIPFTEVNEVRDNAVVIAVDREAVDTQGWDRAPRTA